MAALADLRRQYHLAMHNGLLGHRLRRGSLVYKTVEGNSYTVWTNADSHNNVSVVLADGVAQRSGAPAIANASQGSTLGSLFETITRDFVSEALALFADVHARSLVTIPGRRISDFAQFAHLGVVESLVRGNPQLEAALGGDYLVAPDILVIFNPLDDDALNAASNIVDASVAQHSAIRQANSALPILHATISCKWTMRRDRAQNTRLEALNLVRNRKGRLPHVAAVTMETDPEILGSLCLGTGDIDCVYHGALHELIEVAEDAANTLRGRQWTAVVESLRRMVDGSRLRDISDLPLDLMI